MPAITWQIAGSSASRPLANKEHSIDVTLGHSCISSASSRGLSQCNIGEERCNVGEEQSRCCLIFSGLDDEPDQHQPKAAAKRKDDEPDDSHSPNQGAFLGKEHEA